MKSYINLNNHIYIVFKCLYQTEFCVYYRNMKGESNPIIILNIYGGCLCDEKSLQNVYVLILLGSRDIKVNLSQIIKTK